MNEKQCAFAPSGQQYVFEYRVAGLQLGQDIPFFTTVTLPVQEELDERTLFVDGAESAAMKASGEEPNHFLAALLWSAHFTLPEEELGERTLFVDGAESAAMKASGEEPNHSALLRSAHWAWLAEQNFCLPFYEEWVQDVSACSTPYLYRLFAKLVTYHHMLFLEHKLSLTLPVIGLDTIANLYPPCFLSSTDTNGILTIGINTEDDVVMALVDSMVDVNETYYKQADLLRDIWDQMGPWLWKSYMAMTLADMEIDLGQETFEALSEDELSAAFNTYAFSDEQLYSDTLYYLMNGYIHTIVLQSIQPEWVRLKEYADLQVLRSPAYDGDARETAVRNIAKRLGHPLRPPRRRSVQHAAHYQYWPKDELQQHILSSLFEIISQIPPFIPDELPQVYRRIRNRLNDLLPIHLLEDPHWRQRQYQIPLDYAQKTLAQNPIVQVECQLTMRQALARAHLTHREFQIEHALLQGASPQEIAADFGISPATVRVHHHNAVQKIKKIEQKI